jgi:exopolysaccharide biosynthesis predicted pyruvyltransferase EpsI
LDKKQWLEVASHKYDLKNYLLVYNLNSLNTEIKRCAQTVAKEKNLKIVSVEEYGKITYADVRITDAGPSEFVELFSKASFVVTNSFHATAFSLLFNVPFFSIIKNKTASRINDVLEMVDLKDRMNPETVSEVAPICWTRVNDCLSRNRNKSVDFLENSLL